MFVLEAFVHFVPVIVIMHVILAAHFFFLFDHLRPIPIRMTLLGSTFRRRGADTRFVAPFPAAAAAATTTTSSLFALRLVIRLAELGLGLDLLLFRFVVATFVGQLIDFLSERLLDVLGLEPPAATASPSPATTIIASRFVGLTRLTITSGTSTFLVHDIGNDSVQVIPRQLALGVFGTRR